MITFEHVTKQFNGQSGVNDISFTVEQGELVFLVGASGAGKTTILRLIRRDLLPESGKIIVGEWDVTKVPNSKVPLLRRYAPLIFQDFKVLTDRTVEENIAIALQIRGEDPEEIAKRVPETLTLVGLEKKGKAFPIQLSAGELQRVSIARAVIGKPKLLLADEPTGNLDPKTGWDIIKVLGDINKTGTTVLMATHNIDVVNSMKKRVMVIKDGKISSDKKDAKYSE